MSTCKRQMLADGHDIVPRTCPVHGIFGCPEPIQNRSKCSPLAPGDALSFLAASPSARKGGFIQTFTGVQFWPLDPRPEEIKIEDIAHSLAMQCRYGGHVLRFYSVAEHCVLLSQIARTPGLAFHTLMHDASEAYLVDVPRPVKAELANYKKIEANLERCIAQRFGLAWPTPPEVHSLDSRILRDERMQNMTPVNWDWCKGGNVADGDPVGAWLQYWTPAEAEREFLAAFNRL